MACDLSIQSIFPNWNKGNNNNPFWWLCGNIRPLVLNSSLTFVPGSIIKKTHKNKHNQRNVLYTWCRIFDSIIIVKAVCDWYNESYNTFEMTSPVLIWKWIMKQWPSSWCHSRTVTINHYRYFSSVNIISKTFLNFSDDWLL